MGDVAQRYVADFSLALINRTGAYHVCREIVDGLPQFFSETRYWRLALKQEPRGLVRKVMGRLMLYDLNLRRPDRAGTRSGAPTLFMDPLYVLGRRLKATDIVICHDVGPVTHTALFDAGTVAAYARAYDIIQRVKPGMVFVSEASRLAFAGIYGTGFRFLKVIPLYVRDGIDHGAMTPPAGVEAPFLLTVAATEVRKNFARSIAAFAQSGLAARGFKYVICGPRGNAEAEVSELASTTRGVVKLGFVSDAELRWLYGHASGFVLPSLLEGFGVPALEAGRRGLVPLVSAGGALEEAVGPGGLTVVADSIADIAGGMVRLAEMTAAERTERLVLLSRHADRHTRGRYLSDWQSLLEADGRGEVSAAHG